MLLFFVCFRFEVVLLPEGTKGIFLAIHFLRELQFPYRKSGLRYVFGLGELGVQKMQAFGISQLG